MVMNGSNRVHDFPWHLIRSRIARALEEVDDPEIPGLSIVDLGMVMDIRPGDHQWSIDLATTYSGCPAIDVIPVLARMKLAESGFGDAEVKMRIDPPWSTEWISEAGKQKLLVYGIAPPIEKTSSLTDEGKPHACPQCGSRQTTMISRYGSTPCKAVYRCDACQETFDYFKCY